MQRIFSAWPEAKGGSGEAGRRRSSEWRPTVPSAFLPQCWAHDGSTRAWRTVYHPDVYWRNFTTLRVPFPFRSMGIDKVIASSCYMSQTRR